jgi:hypothetical protein
MPEFVRYGKSLTQPFLRIDIIIEDQIFFTGRFIKADAVLAICKSLHVFEGTSVLLHVYGICFTSDRPSFLVDDDHRVNGDGVDLTVLQDFNGSMDCLLII